MGKAGVRVFIKDASKVGVIVGVKVGVVVGLGVIVGIGVMDDRRVEEGDATDDEVMIGREDADVIGGAVVVSC